MSDAPELTSVREAHRFDEQALFDPYRLKVILVENKRVNGKVKQETIAVLGSIEGSLLPEFWEGISREKVTELKTEDWEIQCLRARIAFWDGANRRLKRQGARVDLESPAAWMLDLRRGPLLLESHPPQRRPRIHPDA